jgi:hypothetical protein
MKHCCDSGIYDVGLDFKAFHFPTDRLAEAKKSRLSVRLGRG